MSEGATSVEYSLMVVLVAIALIGTVILVRSSTQDLYCDAASSWPENDRSPDDCVSK